MDKIVIIGPAYPLRGGLATFDERLAREFNTLGDNCILLSYSLQYPSFLFPGTTQFSDEEAPKDLEIHSLINTINPFSWFKAAKFINKQKPTIVVIRYWLPFMAPALGVICRLLNKSIKIVTITDNVNPHEKFPFSKQLNKFFLGKSDAFICMSDKVKTDLLAYSDNKSIQLQEHPLYDNFGEGMSKSEACKLLNINENGKYVLFFGFIRRYKGLDLLLNAFAQKELYDSDIQLIIAGEYYEKKEYYTEIIEKNNLQNKIIDRTGFIPNSEVRNYFSAADLIGLTYHSATQSGVTQVAYHFNKPMLITNVGGLAETVPHNHCGLVVEPNEIEIAASILHFFKGNLGEKMTENISAYKSKFSWSKLCNTIKEIK